MGRVKYKAGSYLYNNSRVPEFSTSCVDGVDFINISIKSSTILGKRLSTAYIHNFHTVFGDVSSMRNIMDALIIEDYPYEFLAKGRLSDTEKKSISKNEFRSIPNYWAIVAYAFIEKVQADKQLLHLMKENTLPYTSIIGVEEKLFFNDRVNMYIPNKKLGKYIAIVKGVEEMIKSDTFDKYNIRMFLDRCKEAPELNHLENVSLKVL